MLILMLITEMNLQKRFLRGNNQEYNLLWIMPY